MLDVLKGLVRDITTAPSFAHAANTIVTQVTTILNADICLLYIVDRSKHHLHMISNGDLAQSTIRDIPLKYGEGIVGLVVERSEPVNLADVTQHPRFKPIQELDEERFKVFLGAPMIHHRRVLGVLVVRRTEKKFSEDEEGFLGSLATRIAHVVAHAEATQEIVTLQSTLHDTPDRFFKGQPSSPGIAIGRAVLVDSPTDIEQVPDRKVVDVERDLHAFDAAVNKVVSDYQRTIAELESSIAQEDLALFDAYLHMLDGEAIPGEVRQEISNGQWAQGALRRVIQRHTELIERSDNPYLAERSSDVRQLGESILKYLQNVRTPSDILTDPSILVGEEITADMLDNIRSEKCIGIISRRGSANSHMSILARALNLPAVVGAIDLPLFDIENRSVAVDGCHGEIVVNPSLKKKKHYATLIEEDAAFARTLDELKDLPSETRDGHRVNMWVNIGLVGDITQSLDRGAEGIGLFRTEIPFASRDQFPTEEEQRVIYREHMEAFEPRPVTMRTLDIGGDKALPYFDIQEENPYLGWRGIRVTLDHPEIFLVQVRAMIKANAGLKGTLRIMLPMISSMHEVQEAIELINRAYAEVVEERFDVKRPDVGAMIEVPAAIYQARQIAREVDFLAVGSNDLTQYMLAVSRTNPRVADLYCEYHPSVLRALRELVKAAHAERKGIGICGELAGTPEGAILCVGMGYDVLSMNAINLLRVKWVIRNSSLTSCRRILSRVLKMDHADEILTYIRYQLTGAGLEQAIPHHDKV